MWKHVFFTALSVNRMVAMEVYGGAVSSQAQALPSARTARAQGHEIKSKQETVELLNAGKP